MSNKSCSQTNLATDNSPLLCDEFISSQCIIHPGVLSELNLPANSTMYSVIQALLNSVIALSNKQISPSGGVIEVQKDGSIVLSNATKINFTTGLSVLVDSTDSTKVNISADASVFTINLDASNNLSILRNGSVVSSVNLSSLLDNTNTPRIISAQVVGTDMVFTRDDSTTLNVDVSQLIGGSTPEVTGGQLVGDNLIIEKSDSSTVTIPLTGLLNNTNLPRVVSGSISGTDLVLVRDDSTNIIVNAATLLDSVQSELIVSGQVIGTDIVFTKMDSSTLTVDASALLSDLPRIVSGAVAGDTLILTRDDTTQVDIDITGLNQDASEIPVAFSPVNYGAVSADVEGHLQGLDARMTALIQSLDSNFIDYTGSGLIGVQDNTNTTFEVSEGLYLGDILVFLNGQLLHQNNGIVQTDPANGIFNFEDAPEPTDEIFVHYSTTNGGTVSGGGVPQLLSLAGNDLTISGGNTITLPISGGTDENDFITGAFLSGNVLTLTGTGTAGTSIDLTPIQDGFESNTDFQTLSVSGNVLTITGGNSITLPISGGGTDGNDFITGANLVGTTLNITGTGTAGATIDLSPILTGIDTDDQTLSIIGRNISISNGNTITVPETDPQTLSVTGNNLSILGGNTVTLPTSGTGGVIINSSTIENLSGTINGTNTDFTVSQGEFEAGSLKIHRNGQTYTSVDAVGLTELDSTTGTFRIITPPTGGEVITVEYNLIGSSSGIVSIINTELGQTSWQSGGSSTTDLSYNSSTRLLESSTGNDVTLPLATESQAGLIPSYSEGDFTPTLTATGGGSYNIGNLTANYVKIGKQVSFSIDATSITSTAPSGIFRVDNLPFLAATGQEFVTNVRINNVTSGDSFYTILARIEGNSINFSINTVLGNNIPAQYSAPEFSNGVLVLTGTYFTD